VMSEDINKVVHGGFFSASAGTQHPTGYTTHMAKAISGYRYRIVNKHKWRTIPSRGERCCRP
jgi:hypothetical protein